MADYDGHVKKKKPKEKQKVKAPKKGWGLFGGAARALEDREKNIDKQIDGKKPKHRK